MTPATPNPILAVNTLGHATPLDDAAAQAGWARLDNPTPRELLRAAFLRSHAVVVVGLGGFRHHPESYDPCADAMLQALHTSTHTAQVIAAGFDADDATEQRARRQGVSLYLDHPTPAQLIAAAQALLPARLRATPAAPVADRHPAPADPAVAPRSHLAKLLAHPPPPRAGPKRRVI